MFGSIKVTFSWWRKFIVFLAVWDGAPSCCNVQLWRPHYRLNLRQETSSENMFTIVFTVYFGAWFNEHNTSFPHSRHTKGYHDTAAEMFTFSYKSPFWNLPFLWFNWINTIILRIDWRGNGECLFVCKPNASYTSVIRKPFKLLTALQTFQCAIFVERLPDHTLERFKL